MSNPVELNIFGIKCDACDFNDKTVSVDDYPNWLNKPCPNCGENLLTETDYNNVKMLMSFAEIANSILPASNVEEEKIAVSVEMDGSGKMDLFLKEYNKSLKELEKYTPEEITELLKEE